MVEDSPGYLADHWCTKGHIQLCLEGELHTELANGHKFILMPGVSYQVGRPRRTASLFHADRGEAVYCGLWITNLALSDALFDGVGWSLAHWPAYLWLHMSGGLSRGFLI